jgi:hypothetical protein
VRYCGEEKKKGKQSFFQFFDFSTTDGNFCGQGKKDECNTDDCPRGVVGNEDELVD